jgi:hypothetical protein
MTRSIARLTLGLGLLGAAAMAPAADSADEITVQVIGEEGAKAITQQIRLPVRARQATPAREQREAMSEQRRQFEEQAREQRSESAGGRGAGGR